MRSVWHSLAWKEWHEHKWKLASIVAILWGVTSLALLMAGQEMFDLALGLLFLSIVPLAVFVGLGAAANERSSGTLLFLQSLPVPMWRVALSKLLFGLLTIFVPIVLTVLLFYLWTLGLDALGVDYRDALRRVAKGSPLSDTGNWYLDAVIFCAPIAASLLIWSAATGVNRKDEISAGAVALAVMAGWCLLLTLMFLLFLRTEAARPDDGKGWLAVIGLSTAPGGIGAANDVSDARGDYLMLSLFTAAITHLALATWYVVRFGRIANVEIRSPQVAVRGAGRHDWLAPPRQSMIAAIAWKQVRESGPIVLTGLAGIVVVVAVFIAGNALAITGTHVLFGWVYARVAIVFGFFVALVVGIGVCLYDVGPRLNTFWRSRPIHPDLWFWCKYATGLAVLLAVIYVPILLIAALGDTSVDDGTNYPEAINIPLGQIAVFAAAVAMTCLVRHAVYAAILSIPMVYLGIMLVWMTIVMARLIGWVERPIGGLWELSDMQVAAGFVMSFVISTLVAWLAVRYDWGYKSRY